MGEGLRVLPGPPGRAREDLTWRGSHRQGRTGGSETCTLETERLVVDGHGKGPAEWIRLNAAAVSYDHPARETPDHIPVIDFWGEAGLARAID